MLTGGWATTVLRGTPPDPPSAGTLIITGGRANVVFKGKALPANALKDRDTGGEATIVPSGWPPDWLTAGKAMLTLGFAVMNSFGVERESKGLLPTSISASSLQPSPSVSIDSGFVPIWISCRLLNPSRSASPLGPPGRTQKVQAIGFCKESPLRSVIPPLSTTRYSPGASPLFTVSDAVRDALSKAN